MPLQPWSQLVLIVYDVTSDRRRTRLHKLLSRYGVPVQESAFEARLERAEKTMLLDEIERLINKEEDAVNVYPIPKDVEEKVVELGKPRPKVEFPDFFIME